MNRSSDEANDGFKSAFKVKTILQIFLDSGCF